MLLKTTRGMGGNARAKGPELHCVANRVSKKLGLKKQSENLGGSLTGSGRDAGGTASSFAVFPTRLYLSGGVSGTHHFKTALVPPRLITGRADNADWIFKKEEG